MTDNGPKVVVVTGASSGFGALTTRALGRRRHIVYAGMRQTATRNELAVRDLKADAKDAGLDLRPVEMDVRDQESVDQAIALIHSEHGRLDVVVHNAGHMVLGPAEAFTPEQMADIYDVNVLGTQRVNRAALPHLRSQEAGLLVWVGSTSSRGGCPPFLAPYFAAKAAMDALAVSYAAELIRFGIETSIVVLGAFTSGTNHFLNAGSPDDEARSDAYNKRYGKLRTELDQRLAALIPPDANVDEVAERIGAIVDLPAGTRPFRVHIDPSRDGSEVVSAVADRVRAEFFHRVGIEDLLTSHSSL